MQFVLRLANDSGVRSLLNALDVFFLGVAVAELFLFGVTNRVCNQRVDFLRFGIT